MRRASVLLLILLLFGHTAAQTNPDLERIRGDIAKLRQKLEDVRTQTQSAERQLEEVGIELDIRTRELEIATRIEADLEQQQHALENQVAMIAGRIAQQKEFLRHRLGALYRLGRLSYARLLLSIDDHRDPLQAVSMLTYLASRDARAISRF
jgi:septal ring factor EnvC (AmiA/AmiB activator)